jgi:hypothetical protein
MQITLVGKKNGRKQKKPLQKRFEKLHKQIERQRRLNERFEKELDELVHSYRQHTQEANLKQLDTLIALATKLATFASRKSLSEWQRNEIGSWLEDLVIHRITPLAPEAGQKLQNQYEESLAKVLGMTTEQLQEHIQESFSNASKEEYNNSFEEEDEDYQDDLFGFDDVPPDPDDWFRQAGETKQEDYESFGDWNPRDQLMDSTWIKTLFRRAAQNLHPDREPDPESRRHKQQQLTELLSARKENDVLTILKIYSEALDGQEIQLAEKELKTVCELLEEQLDELESEQTAYVHAHPERELVYDLFYHTNQKKRQEILKLWQKELEQESAQNRELVVFLRNLNNLKEVLRERKAQRTQFVDWIFEDYETF